MGKDVSALTAGEKSFKPVADHDVGDGFEMILRKQALGNFLFEIGLVRESS